MDIKHCQSNGMYMIIPYISSMYNSLHDLYIFIVDCLSRAKAIAHQRFAADENNTNTMTDLLGGKQGGIFGTV